MPKYTSPLNADTVSSLNAPPVRLGLQTKLNLLAIGLIVAIAVGISAFLIRQQVQYLISALSVVASLVLIAIIVTLLLTRRLVAPIRQLMRAARAVGAGKLDVYVPVSSSDELVLLTHTLHHTTHRLIESQGAAP